MSACPSTSSSPSPDPGSSGSRPAAAAAAHDDGALLIDIRPIHQRSRRRRDPRARSSSTATCSSGAWTRTSPDRIPEVEGHDQTVIVFCDEGYASSLAAASLQAVGLRRATDLDGGYQAWRAADLPTTPPFSAAPEHRPACRSGPTKLRRAGTNRARLWFHGGMSELHPLPIGSERVTTGDEIVIRSPFDGTELGRVPKGGPDEVDARGARRRDGARTASRSPRGSAPRSSTAASHRIGERNEELAQSIAAEAAKPIKTARIEAARAVGTFAFAAVEARTLTGEMIAMDAQRRRRRQARLHAAGADRRRRRDQPVQLPAQPRRATSSRPRSRPGARSC